MSLPTEQSFLKDVATHALTIVKDDGHHRHIRFERPNSYNMHFDIVTWPGYLAYSGDMGCFVFSRIDDMFDFFRNSPDRPELQINLGYWCEKLDAVDKPDGAMRFSPELFEQAIKDRLDEAEASTELRQQVAADVLTYLDDGQHAAYSAATQFVGDDSEKFRFTDFWETRCDEYTFRFIWCCYALAWGIKQYDAAKVTATDGQQ